MHVLYHGNCPDGFGAALSAWLKYGDDAIYTPVYHNEGVPKLQSKDILIVDFCYPLDIMLEIAKKFNTLTLIDHHQGVSDVIEKLKLIDNVTVVFNQNHSGSSLTWQYLNPNVKVPKLIQFIEDRDCHFNKLKDANSALMWLDTQPFVFSLWRVFSNFSDEIWDKIIAYNKPMVKNLIVWFIRLQNNQLKLL
ncbi:hypothetical protein GW796_10260 [archaeon]|nr:hypothetical protein [archaeon]